MTQFDWNAAAAHLDATQEEYDRESRMGQARDKLIDYRVMRDSMLDFLWSLRRGNLIDVATTEVTIGCMLLDIENANGWKVMESEPEENICQSARHDNRAAAEQAIDDHFAGYLRQARAIANGEGL